MMRTQYHIIAEIENEIHNVQRNIHLVKQSLAVLKYTLKLPSEVDLQGEVPAGPGHGSATASRVGSGGF